MLISNYPQTTIISNYTSKQQLVVKYIIHVNK